jgi:hypothetical protein
MREGYRLLRAVHEARLPVVFSVPEDLAADLLRLGWKALPAWVQQAAHRLGVPEGKVILVPGGLARLCWIAIRQGWQFADAEPPPHAAAPRWRRITRPHRLQGYRLRDVWPGRGGVFLKKTFNRA